MRKQFQPIAGAAAVVVAALSSCATHHSRPQVSAPPSAEERAHHRLVLFAQLDHNGDGRVSEQEFVEACLYAAFVQRDVDGDGWVSRAEWSNAGGGSRATRLFTSVDADRSDGVTYAEICRHPDCQPAVRAQFEKLDTNRDGLLTLAELPPVAQ